MKKLIYANALLSTLRDDKSINGANLRRVIQHINAAPAVDTVVHGRWQKYRDHFTERHIGWICTNCSAVSFDLSNGDTTFCPHCGALMDLEDEEDA